MIPVSLTIKGLYSYQEAQEIDFNKLTEGQLFGIFGAVGSGKSSILEAISFALYGETERLNLRENRGYNMMNLKSDELLIDFIFKNYDRQEYRFLVKGKRNKRDFEKVDSFDRSAFKKDNNQWIPLESNSAEKIIGLSYDNFRRTIIIPQGKFQEFLQLTDMNRTNMLKEIFQLEKFEFFYQTTALEKKNNEAIQVLSGQLSHYLSATPEIISQKDILVKELSENLDAQRKDLSKKETELKELEEQKRQFEDLESSRKNLADLLFDEKLYEQHSKKIADYDYCRLHFKDSLNRKKELENGISERKNAISGLKASYKKCCDDLELLEKEAETVNKAYSKHDEQKEILSDYEYILQLLELKSKIVKLTTRIADGQVHVATALREKTNSESKIELLKLQLREQRTSIPDVTALANLRAWFVKKDQQCRSITDMRLEHKTHESNLQLISEDIIKQLRHPVLVNVKRGVAPDYYSEQVKELRKELKEKQESLHNQIAQYNLQMKLGEFSSQLCNEESCMLCGSTNHPNILVVEDVKQELDNANIEINRHKDLDESYESILGELSRITYREQQHIQQVETLKGRLNAELLAEKEHLESFNWSGFTVNDQQKVEDQILNARKLETSILELDKSLETEESIFKTANDDHKKFLEAIEGIQTELIAKEAETATLEGQLKKLTFADHIHIPEEKIRLKITNLSREIISVKERFEKLSRQITDLRLEKGSEGERKKSADDNLAADEERYQHVLSGLKQVLENSAFQDFEVVTLILADEFDCEQLKEQVSHYKNHVFAARKLAEELEKLCAGKSFDLLVYIELSESLEPLAEMLKNANEKYIQEKAELDRFRSDYEQKISLGAELQKLQNRASNISILKNMFKGSGFVSYVSSVYLQNLCLAANERFYKLTRQQLRLEVTAKNDFLVRDYLNNGKTRSVKTLSGGQTFQASLSLALALAESVQQQNKAEQNFFFLDEGFGSLDKESLQVAFDTLKSLRKENRIVGIISHVEELQQEIDVYLNVTNDPILGSKIKGSWD